MFDQVLTADNYLARMHALLYVEEIAQCTLISRFDFVISLNQYFIKNLCFYINIIPLSKIISWHSNMMISFLIVPLWTV